MIDFSDPIYTYGDGLFVPKADTKEYKTLEDLKGVTVGAQVGTAYVEPLQKTRLRSRGEDLRHASPTSSAT